METIFLSYFQEKCVGIHLPAKNNFLYKRLHQLPWGHNNKGRNIYGKKTQSLPGSHGKNERQGNDGRRKRRILKTDAGTNPVFPTWTVHSLNRNRMLRPAFDDGTFRLLPYPGLRTIRIGCFILWTVDSLHQTLLSIGKWSPEALHLLWPDSAKTF